MTKRGRPKGSKNKASFLSIPMSDIKTSLKEELFFARLTLLVFKAKKELELTEEDTNRIIKKVLIELQ